MVPHGAEADATSLQAVGEYAKYKFNPSLISLPTKLGSNYDTNGYIDPTETITTNGPGDWKNAANIALKVQELSYGRITIVKSVNNYKGEPFTCDFSIKSTEDSPYAYENRASLYITSEGDASVTVTDIPAGAKVTVEESYEGAGYALVSSDCDGKVFTIPPDYEVASGMESEITVHFTNDQGGPESGHGVENTFKMVNGKWTFVTDPKPTPESSYLENTDEN